MTFAVPTAGAVRPGRRPSRRGESPRRLLVLALLLLVIGAPLWLVLSTSAKPAAEAQKPSVTLPEDWNVADNYATTFDDGDMVRGLVNSLLVVAPTAVVVLLLGAMAAWIFARRGGRLMAIAYGTAISGLLLPPAVVTLVLELRMIGLANTRTGLVLAYVAMYLPLAIFLMTGFIRNLPTELEEAARVDGAGPIRTFASIVLPILRPVIATATIMVVLFAWSDIFYASFILGGGDRSTLPLNLYQVANANLYQNNWHLIFAYIILMSLPMILVFLVAQRRVISGVTSGAVK